jgi:steroid delta-isomerase-like uncharacterized protein
MEAKMNLQDPTSEWLALIAQHIQYENQHNLDGIMATFGSTAQYDDEPWDEHFRGHLEVHKFYQEFLKAMPDLRIDTTNTYAADNAVVLEVTISGHHQGLWRGLPPTGRSVQIPLCAIFTFDENNRLAGEKIYYDRATVLRQLGVFHEPQTLLGQITTVLTHPITIALIAWQLIKKVAGTRAPSNDPTR